MADIKGKPINIDWKRMYENKKYDTEIHVFNMTVETESGQIIEGIFTTTKQNQTKFTLNEMVMLRQKNATEDHESVIKFDKVPEEQGGRGGSGGGQSRGANPIKDRSIVANVSILVATRMLINNEYQEEVKNDLTAVTTLAKKVFDHIMIKADGNTQQSITIQAQVKIVSELFFQFPNVEMKTSSDILAAADKLIDWVNLMAKG